MKRGTINIRKRPALAPPQIIGIKVNGDRSKNIFEDSRLLVVNNKNENKKVDNIAMMPVPPTFVLEIVPDILSALL